MYTEMGKSVKGDGEKERKSVRREGKRMERKNIQN